MFDYDSCYKDAQAGQTHHRKVPSKLCIVLRPSMKALNLVREIRDIGRLKVWNALLLKKKEFFSI